MKAKNQPNTRHPHLQRGLHPASLMTLLCAGVFLVAATVSAFGDSYNVSATVPSDPPASAAIITSLSDGATVTTPSQTISGSCPDNAYVVLTLNNQVSGSAWCSGDTFSIVTSLQNGPNQLGVQDYNALNNPGPASPTISVTYAPPAQPSGNGGITGGNGSTSSAAALPVSLAVTQVDTGVAYGSAGNVADTSLQPTFHGIAPPFSHVTLIVHSNVITCDTTADANGYWQCTLPSALPDGLHTVVITAITTRGQMLEVPTFSIHAKTNFNPNQAAAAPLSVISNYHYQAYLSGQLSNITLQLHGGNGPYAVTVNWGDGKTTTQTVAMDGPLSLPHRYNSSLVLLHTYTAKVTIIDSTGQAINSQFITVVRNPVAGSTNVQYQPPNLWQTAQQAVHDWLWLLWPAYLIVVLMLISFVLGERKQYESDRPTSAVHKARPRRHTPRHA